MAMTSQNDIITDCFKFDFVTISLKNHNLVKSPNFRSPILKIRHISAKIQPKNLKQHFDWGASDPPLATGLL